MPTDHCFFTAKIGNSVLLKPRNVIATLIIFEHFPSFYKKFITSAVVRQKNTLTVFVFY